MKKKFFCLFLSFYLMFSNLFITYDTAYATGLDAVAGWEAAVAGVGGTLLLPFGQVAFLLFSLFGVTIAVNNGESIKEAGQEMWNEFTDWYEDIYLPGLDVAHEKKNEMMQELANWEEKAEDGIFSKVSQVWDALKEFAKYVLNIGSSSVVKNSNVVKKNGLSWVLDGTTATIPVQGDYTSVWGVGSYEQRGRDAMKVTAEGGDVALFYRLRWGTDDVYGRDFCCLYYYIVFDGKSKDVRLSWQDLVKDSYANNGYSNPRTYKKMYYYYHCLDLYSLKGKKLSRDIALDIPNLGSIEGLYGDMRDLPSNVLDDVQDIYGQFMPNELAPDHPSAGDKEMSRTWNKVAGNDKANVQENDEAVILTGDGIRSKEKSKEKEQEAEAEMEGVLSNVSDVSKSKEKTKEQSEALEKAYEKTGVKGVSDEKDVEKEISKSVNLAASENSEYQLKGLEKVFPFCVPFDIYDFINCLSASPKAPKFTYKFYFKKNRKKVYDNIEIDLSAFDDLAEFLRLCELLLFIVGLAFVTRSHYVK